MYKVLVIGHYAHENVNKSNDLFLSMKRTEILQIFVASHHFKRYFFYKKAHIKYVGRRRGWRVLQIFRKIFRSPGDHRPKYFIAQ